jgi:hypothetical protein
MRGRARAWEQPSGVRQRSSGKRKPGQVAQTSFVLSCGTGRVNSMGQNLRKILRQSKNTVFFSPSQWQKYILTWQVYAGLPDAGPHKMNQVVKGAVNLCTAIYVTIGGTVFYLYVLVRFSNKVYNSVYTGTGTIRKKVYK